jgi:hypothetical protein
VLYAQGRIPTPSVRLPLLAAAQSTVDRALSDSGCKVPESQQPACGAQ